MFIDGIGISNFRSFGSLQKIGPFSRINLMIGQNNSGKSNILQFLALQYPEILKTFRNEKANQKYSLLDRHLGKSDELFRVSFAVSFQNAEYNRFMQDKGSPFRAMAEKIFRSNVLAQGTEIAWFTYEVPWGRPLTPSVEYVSKDLVSALKSDRTIPKNYWQEVWSRITGQTGGSLEQHWIPETLVHFSRLHFTNLKTTLIPAIRRIGEKGGASQDDFSGLGIIDRLAQLQNPGYNAQHLKDSFEAINGFLRTVTDNQTATLEIPYERDTILVHMDEKALPLTSLGTGIHEVVILAAAATILQKQVVCIEEPELHLHPILQKKLVRYLRDKTDNQYFITTHSAHLLDSPNASIFHVRYEDGETHVEHVDTAKGRSFVCTDLGYRASDLLQSNCIIWVEGPSDRIYLNHWLRAIDADLVEGLHYSIMFYGGRLLSHLTANDPEIDDFISLRSLNRHIAIAIDSDKSDHDDSINETKLRIEKEFNEGPGFAWITQGREIENYIRPQLLELAVKEVHKQAVALVGAGQYEDRLRYTTEDGQLKAASDKVKIAHRVIDQPADLDVLDLKLMIVKLVGFIRESNGIDK